MKHFITIAFILTVSSTAFSQEMKWLRVKIKNADSVLLVSHEETNNFTIEDTARKRRIPGPKLMTGGKPNYKIVRERQIISGYKLDRLVKILARPFQDTIIEGGKCFMPHHAIFIFKNGKTSYINICFGCHVFDPSKDLRMIGDFDNRKWTELEDYFLKLGFKYELAQDQE